MTSFSSIPARVSEFPRTVSALVDELSEELRTGQARELVPIPTGFQPLDNVLGGGLHPGELMLVGGAPGSGKTIMALQWARNLARSGVTVLYVGYEHEESDLLMRLLAMEMGERPGADDPELEKVRLRLQDAAARGGMGLRDVLSENTIARHAYERMETYADRLWLLKASGRYTDGDELERIVRPHAQHRAVLIVDYLQKIALHPQAPDEAEKVTRVTEGLKDLALRSKIPIVSIVAADREGLKERRLHLHHLRGSSALAFEADVALILNEKWNVVSKVHLAYDAVHAGEFHDWTILTVEKNRAGPNLVDLQFRKDFPHFRFDPVGGLVAEKLVDERLYVE